MKATNEKQIEKKEVMEGVVKEVVEESKEIVLEQETKVESVEVKSEDVKESKEVVKEHEYKEALITIWKNLSKDGKRSYLSGFMKNNKVVGYFTTRKISPNEPDLKIYFVENNNIEGECCSLWSHVSSNGDKYYSGYLAGKSKIKVVGFLVNSDNEKAPYLKVYKQDELEVKDKNKEEIKEDLNKDINNIPEEVQNLFNNKDISSNISDDDLPF